MIKPLINILLEVRVVIFSLLNQCLHVLLINNNPDSDGNKWVIPGQFVSENESLEKTANNCLLYYTGLQESYLEQLYTYGDIERYINQRIISVVYFALIPTDFIVDSISRSNLSYWYSIEELPVIYFDHKDIILYALRRLRYKLEYSAVGFQLLPNLFSLSELQQTYEIILGEKLDKRNFRRRILEASIIEPTSNRRVGEGRPAQLFRYRPDAIAEIKARRLFP